MPINELRATKLGTKFVHRHENFFLNFGNKKGNADREFNKMDYFVVKSLRRWQYRRGGQRPTKRAPYTGDQLYGMGLHRLMGTAKYPAQATPRRSSLSRVPENGMHGLKGEIRNGLA
jgi:hypothetical protein